MRLAICAFAVAILSAASPAQAIILCTTPDGKSYAGDQPPPDCKEKARFGKNASGSASGSSSASSFEDLKKGCAIEWPGDYKMQEYCIKQQGAAAIELGHIIDQNPNDQVFNGIIQKCGSEWPGKATDFDYKMMLYCVKQQSSAYNRLH